MTGSQLGDFISLTTNDGQVLSMPDQQHSFTVYGSFGAPPTNFITKQGYKQHGETEIGYILGKRTVSLTLHRTPGCTRAQYWANRALLHDFLRPNRNGPLTLTLIQTGGTDRRALTVRADPGLVLAPDQQREASWNIDEAVNFVAFDPIWFDPAGITKAVAVAANQNLVFPITFPIVFGTSGLLFTQVITYAGSWYEYPTITLTGPYQSAVVTNVTTGVSFFMNVPLVGGAQRIIATRPGSISILDQNGVNCFGELGPNSNLVNFNLRPDPEVSKGLQTLICTMIGGNSGAGTQSGFQISYYSRYLAI